MRRATATAPSGTFVISANSSFCSLVSCTTVCCGIMIPIQIFTRTMNSGNIVFIVSSWFSSCRRRSCSLRDNFEPNTNRGLVLAFCAQYFMIRGDNLSDCLRMVQILLTHFRPVLTSVIRHVPQFGYSGKCVNTLCALIRLHSFGLFRRSETMGDRISRSVTCSELPPRHQSRVGTLRLILP